MFLYVNHSYSFYFSISAPVHPQQLSIYNTRYWFLTERCIFPLLEGLRPTPSRSLRRPCVVPGLFSLCCQRGTWPTVLPEHTELYTGNIHNLVNQCHPNEFNTTTRPWIKYVYKQPPFFIMCCEINSLHVNIFFFKFLPEAGKGGEKYWSNNCLFNI